MNIGSQIRKLRISKKLTQKQLAEKINVTNGYISQIENNLISPSLKILFALLKIFKMTAAEFFKQKKNIELIHKKNDFFVEKNPKLKNTTFHLFPSITKYNIEPIIIEIEYQGQTTMNNKPKEDIFGFVLEGEVLLILNKIQYFLKKGDAFYLSTDKKYYLLNDKPETVKILKVLSSFYE
ncbi:helix-turn-helix transcriptional regulator [Candidatus Phytoplasma luffae]|uniref:Helix-turn-helix transcriptional regulator n=1 Tax=Loofah witches'-broom phytoplasma TaxID=35773 RepID=A0A975ILY2_LOWBP|nr:helix-turn-helix transcriptional regulator [Candidatus Phytoplasma luffae]QTX02917.1 helix-turn-helix transcriptional regulator [Candidatus Phytoplasma luffae]QTX02984.1 helix-turn-helix transcriptional regulator [Candidatus Phytoplasma luffae]